MHCVVMETVLHETLTIVEPASPLLAFNLLKREGIIHETGISMHRNNFVVFLPDAGFWTNRVPGIYIC